MKTLSLLHALACGSLLALLASLRSHDSYLPLLALLVFLLLTGATFLVMYRESRASLGGPYATRNLALAIAFTLVCGLGLLVWPYLVRTEIRKATRSV
jgi:cytochrome bd-type quinol oxidase subunit 2